MKFSKYFMLAGAAAMLAACSSEEPVPAPGVDQDLSDVETYASFSIAMPDDGTRAVTAENGDKKEYAVKNGKILIFGLPNGVSDQNVAGRVQAKYIAAAELTINDGVAGGAGSDVSATHQSMMAAFTKGTFTATNYSKFYGVCILNYTDNWLPSSGDTFKDWAENQTLAGNLVDGEGYMVMTNAAQYVVGNPSVLVEIDKSKVKDIVEDVKEDAAAFCVQRVAAKMTLANAATNGVKEFDVENTKYTGAKATLVAWAMDLTRKTAYPVQNVWDENVADFFKAGAKAWFHIGTDHPRCDWASSKFYTTEFKDAAECLANFNHIGNGSLNKFESKAEYIRPNTARYDRMTKGNTTRMMIKADFKLDAVEAGTTFFVLGKEKVAYTAATLKKNVEDFCTGTLKMTNPVVTIKDTNAGYCAFGDLIEVTAITAAGKAQLLEHLGIYSETAAEIATYLNGECYYPVYIRHFADEQEAAGITVNTKADDKIVYNGDYSVDHTGRYGIQRNSWYEVKVNKITGPGLPTVPDPDPTVPVDRVEDDQRHMQVSVNIMKWSKRTQNVEL